MLDKVSIKYSEVSYEIGVSAGRPSAGSCVVVVSYYDLACCDVCCCSDYSNSALVVDEAYG